MVLATAARGLFEPIWSTRILEEWARAAQKLGPVGEAQARGEIAVLRAEWPRAERAAAPGTERRLFLPDPNDVHVLAVAIEAGADALMTMNAKDFPKSVLTQEGITRVDPDSYLRGLWEKHPDVLAQVAQDVLARAERLSGKEWLLRKLLKKARLPKLAKALGEIGRRSDHREVRH